MNLNLAYDEAINKVFDIIEKKNNLHKNTGYHRTNNFPKLLDLNMQLMKANQEAVAIDELRGKQNETVGKTKFEKIIVK